MKLKGSSRSSGAVPVLQKKINLKTIDKLSKKRKGFNFFTLEGKENRLQLAKKPNLSPEQMLSEKMAVGLNLSQGSEAPIPKPVLSFKEPNYFKRSFSMRAKSSEIDLKTATIRRTFGKSLTSKENIIQTSQFNLNVPLANSRECVIYWFGHKSVILQILLE